MSIHIARDGEPVDYNLLKSAGYFEALNNNRDLRYRQFSDEAVYAFVGFIVSETGDTLIVFPKHFGCQNIIDDAASLFRVITRHPQLHPDKYIGEISNHFDSNYPFAAFLSVFNYYKKYGLYRETENQVSLNSSGRIDWKRTIQQSRKFPIEETVVFSPIKYRSTRITSTLITECMAFVIAYTLSHFGFFFGAEYSGIEPTNNLLENREYILGKLFEERNRSFLDSKISLIDSLISFFSNTCTGGPYYLKHYSFEKIWESAALSYLCDHFVGIDGGRLQFSDDPVAASRFTKAKFCLNLANPDQTMEPDYYLLNDGVQCIFDAKYYSAVEDIDYKQLVYTILLNHLINPATGEEYHPNTCSALILPSEERSSKLHFELDSRKVNFDQAIEIYEERLVARDVLRYYSSTL